MNQTIEEKNRALVLKAFDTLFNKRDYAPAERYWSFCARRTEGTALRNSRVSCHAAYFVPYTLRKIRVKKKASRTAFLSRLRMFGSLGEWPERSKCRTN
jgi:hypothetical protein